jgi:uncharacterized protein
MPPRDTTSPPARRPRMALVVLGALVVVTGTLIAVIDSSDSTVSVVTGRTNVPGLRSSTASTTAAPTTVAAPTAAAAPTTTAAPTGTSSAPKRAARPKSSSPSLTATAVSPLRLWVGGDSLAAGPSWAVFLAARDTGVVRPLAEYQVGTGLVRNEFWDWPKHMDAVVRARDPQVSVFMVGANDDQGIEVNGTSYKPPDEQWETEYRRRVASVMTTLTRGERHLLWIGMPPMRDAEYSASMELLDQIMQDEAGKHPRVTYIDVWKMFSAPGSVGTYAQAVPDENGQVVSMRLDDGIHLNVAGSQRLARAVMAALGKVVTLPPS